MNKPNGANETTIKSSRVKEKNLLESGDIS